MPPALVLAWWTGTATRSDVIGLGFVAAVLLVPAVGVLFLVARRRPARTGREPLAAAFLFVTAVSATAQYWMRVWDGDDLGMGGIVVAGLNLLGFWWPAVAMACAMWTLEALLVAPGGGPRLRARLAVAMVAGATGALAYQVTSTAYYQRVDRSPIENAMVYVEQDFFSLTPRPLAYRLADRHFVIDSPLGPGIDEPPQVVLATLERALESTRTLLDRHDVERVTVILRGASGEFVRFEAAEGDRRRPLRALMRLDRGQLRGGGALDAASLAAMQEDVPEPRDLFAQWFRATIHGDEVRVVFQPAKPPGPETAALYAGAWNNANAIVRRTFAGFGEIARVRVRLPRLDATVDRREVEPDFRLQHRLLPSKRVLGLVVSEPGATGAETIVPGEFLPMSAAPGFQVAVLQRMRHLVQHEAGLLFERIGQAGFAIAIDERGTVEFVIDDHRQVRAGPVRVAVGDRVVRDGYTVENVGWLPRAALLAGK